MAKFLKKITKFTKKFFEKKREEELPKTLFNIVKVLKIEEKKLLKTSYPRLKSPTDLELARIKRSKLTS